MSHAGKFLGRVAEIAYGLDTAAIERMAGVLAGVRKNKGRLFVLGLGGSAANASHAVNDFVKLCDIDAYAPTDNTAEVTARANDEGWPNTFLGWLVKRRIDANDAIFILSVGGGSIEPEVSMPLVAAINYALERGTKIFGIVGRDGGYTKKHADICIVVPTLDPDLVTPLTESFQSVILHGLVCHPLLAVGKAKWEGMK